MTIEARRAHEQALHDIGQARLTGAGALNLSPRRFVTEDGAVHPGNAAYRHLEALPPQLAELDRLTRLDISRTRLVDLGPVAALSGLRCLHFHETPAAALPVLARIGEIEDDLERTAAVLAHLRGQEPALPEATPAPVEAVFRADRLTLASSDAPRLPDAAEARARRAWEAMRSYHGEMTGALAGRNMPSLDRALAAFGKALGGSYDGMNVLALGTHGRRIARISAGAGEMLLDDAAADLAEFAAAISLYLDRFEEWRAYLADAGAATRDAPALADAARPAARDLVRALSLEAWVEADLPARLEETMEEDLADPVAARGAVASLRNLLAAIGRRAVEGMRALGHGARRAARDFGAELRKAAARSAAAAVTAAIIAFVAAQSPLLTALADRLPAGLGWLRDLIRYLGAL